MAFVGPERVGGAVRARRWRAVRAPRFRRPRTGARSALTGSQGALEASPVMLLLQVKSAAARRPLRPWVLVYRKTMTDPLAEPTYKVGSDVSSWPYSKLARAVEHLNRLQSEVGLWSAQQPIRTEGVLDSERLVWSLTMRVKLPPPIQQWSTMLGDCVHNLRSALDAAVWDFATIDGGMPERPNLVQFPVVEFPEQWEKEAAKRLQHVPLHIKERIRITQPLMRPEQERPRDPLILLSYLSNTDKHRANITCGFKAESVNADFSVQFVDDAAAERNVPPNVTIHEPTIEDGALLVEYRANDPIVETHGGFGIAFELLIDTPTGPQKLVDTIGGLIQVVGQILSVMHGGAVRDPGNAVPAGVD